jgi:hypothetical protein
MQDDSDIFDEDTYNLDEENIFDVDFPHEQDELIRSNNVFSTPATAQKPLPRYTTSSTFGNPQTTKRQEPTFRNESSNRTKGMTRSSSGLPSNEGASSPSIHRSPSLTMDAMTNYNTSSSPILRQQQQQRMMARISSTTMTYDDMDDFVKLHRAEIRAVADYTKQENKLVASVMRDLSSGDGNLRSYLESLDQVLEEKMAAIDALKDRINDTMLLIDS